MIWKKEKVNPGYNFCCPEQTSGAGSLPLALPGSLVCIRALLLLSLIDCTLRGPCFAFPRQQIQNTKQLSHFDLNQKWLGDAGSLSTLKGFLPSPRLRVLCGSLWGREYFLALALRGWRLTSFTASGLGNLLHTPGMQRQAASLGSGSEGSVFCCWKRSPLSTTAAAAPPSFPDILVAVWMLAVSRKTSLAVGLHFLLKQLGNIPGKMTAGRPSHCTSLLCCLLQSPSFSPLLLKAGAGSSPWKEEVLSWSRTCPWLSVASAESKRWVSLLDITQ